MKYLIIGTGGTGGCIGGYLAKVGHDVTFIARGIHLQAIKDNGLTIKSSKNGTFTLSNAKAFTMDAYCDIPDIIFVCVKYYNLHEISTFINRIASSHTLVIPILNVFTTGRTLQQLCPSLTVLDGCIYIMGMIESPGVISQFADIFKLYFGYRKGQEHTLEKLAYQVEQDLNAASIEGCLSKHIEREALQKFSFVSPMGAAGLYYQGTGGDFMVPGEKQDTFIRLVQEIEQLGLAMGITFEKPLKEINLKILYDLAKDSTTSLQRDIAKGGPSEIDGLVHCIVRLAHEYNLSLPTYEKISNWAMAHSIL